MRTERQPIRVPRNGDYCEDWQLNDNEGVPIDLSGYGLELTIRAVAGQGPPIAGGQIDLHSPLDGTFTIRISGGDFVTVPGESEVVTLAYDLKVTYPDGVKAIPAEGPIYLTPGVTY